MEGMENGTVTRGEFQRIAANICHNLMKMPAFTHFLGEKDELDEKLSLCKTAEDEALAHVTVLEIRDGNLTVDPTLIHTEKGSTNLFQLFTQPRGVYLLKLTCKAETQNPLAQMNCSIFQEKKLVGAINLTGSDTAEQTFEFPLEPAFMGSCYLKLFFGQTGMAVTDCRFMLIKNMEEEINRILSQISGE